MSKLIRWALGLLLVWIAYNYDDAKALYFIGAVVFATGFFKPKRCTNGSCTIDQH